jgi:AcrR family transcriptional regulator
MRDIAAETEVSLAGLYYYFKAKEEILFLISERSFNSVLQAGEAELDKEAKPEARLRGLIRGHLTYFLGHLHEMKVLSHESDSLKGRYRAAIQDKKRRYVSAVQELLAEIRPDLDDAQHAVATLSLFGMMNWIYTWYSRGKFPSAEAIAEEMAEIFLKGYGK